jgi:hypothetical protein
MTASGPSRHIAPPHKHDRSQGKADIANSLAYATNFNHLIVAGVAQLLGPEGRSIHLQEASASRPWWAIGGPKTSRDMKKDCGEPGCPNDRRSQPVATRIDATKSSSAVPAWSPSA